LGWNRQQGRQTLAQPESFVIREEECLVLAVVELGNNDRPTDRNTELILSERAGRDTMLVVKEIIGI